MPKKGGSHQKSDELGHHSSTSLEADVPPESSHCNESKGEKSFHSRIVVFGSNFWRACLKMETPEINEPQNGLYLVADYGQPVSRPFLQLTIRPLSHTGGCITGVVKSWFWRFWPKFVNLWRFWPKFRNLCINYDGWDGGYWHSWNRTANQSLHMYTELILYIIN